VQAPGQGLARGRRGRGVGARGHVGQQALAPAGHLQQLAVAALAPAPGQAGLGKGQVEGHPVAVALGLGQGAVHVPQQGFEHRGSFQR
jgi:hypothetical protein